ncbi:MAG: CHAT domain-containing protein [Williamsia sp.]|nr:CHAT domain-containing protein [Williamsia sp.]
MGRKLVLLIVVWLIASNSKSQPGVPLRHYKTQYNDAEKYYNAADATDETDRLALQLYHAVIQTLSKSSADDAVLFDSYVKAGILQMSHQQEAASLLRFRAAIRLAKGNGMIPDSALFKPYLYAGSIYYTLYDLDSAYVYYRLAESIVQAYPLVGESERLYNKLGVLYFETGDYKNSMLYFGKALSLVEARTPLDLFFVVNYKNNIASALRKLRRYGEALNLYKSLLPYRVNTKELLHNIGATYLEAGDPRLAIRYLEQVNYSNQVRYNDLARAYLDLRLYDAAAGFLRKAGLARQAPAALHDRDYGITLKLEGDWLMARQQVTGALAKYQQALIQVDPSFNDSLVERNPGSFYGMRNSFLLFDILQAKGRALVQRFSLSGRAHELENALAAYSAALKLAGHVERGYHSDDAKLFLEQNASQAYKESVETCLRLYALTKKKSYLTKAFNFTENSKASVLQTDLHELELNSMGSLPGSAIREQSRLRASIARLNLQINKTADSASGVLQDSLHSEEIRLSSLQDRLENEPGYYQQKFSTKEISVDSIRKAILLNDEALLSYYYYGGKLVIFYITKDSFGSCSATADRALFNDIAAFRRELNAAGAADRKLLSLLATTLYKRLVEPVANKIRGKHKLLIVPYNELSYVPFEALSPPGENKPLLYAYAVSYNYSANFLSRQNLAPARYQVLAMAPFSRVAGAGYLPQLTYSRQEVEALRGRVLVDQEATKQAFMLQYNQYPVVHLATHAVVNDSVPLQSYIEFYNAHAGSNASGHRLYETEVYNLSMSKSRLVVLSACETGNGQLIKEEGIMSLCRAFAYAGCKSVITSLWKADDASTAFIMKQVHVYLKKGLPKDEALQKAKIDYLENDGIDTRYKTPAYWAHLVLIGNSEPIVSRTLLPYILLGLGILVAVAWILVKSRKQLGAYGSIFRRTRSKGNR